MKAVAAGGIEVVVKVINTHIYSPDVCRTGCGAIWNMTINNGKNTDKINNNITNKQLNEQLRTE